MITISLEEFRDNWYKMVGYYTNGHLRGIVKYESDDSIVITII